MNILPLHSVFHPSDFTEGDEGAFAHALKIALMAKAELTILHVDEPEAEVHWSDFPSIQSTLSKWGSDQVDLHALARTGMHVKKVKRTARDPAQAVIEYVADHHPRLIVLATHQREGLSRWLSPAMAEPIARNSHVLTLFVPRMTPGFVAQDSGEVRLSNILIPLAQKPCPQRAVEAAVTMAGTFQLTEVCFHLLHVGSESDRPHVDLPQRAGWTAQYTTWEGDVVDHVLQASKTRNIDLIVMATDGHHGFLDAMRGNTTERVLRGAPCPLLAVPAA